MGCFISTRKLLVLLCLVGGASTVAAGEFLDIGDLNQAERQDYARCSASRFWDDNCMPVLERVCQKRANADSMTCLDHAFEGCSKSDFVGSMCNEVMRKLCDLTNDGYDISCDRYRYETCLKADFRTSGCDLVRVKFTLPILESTIDSLRISARSHDTLAQLKAFFCAKASGQIENPIYMDHCVPEKPGPLNFAGFEKLYRQAQRLPEGARFLERANLFERLLLSSADGSPEQGTDAVSIWLREADETQWVHSAAANNSRILGAQVLAKFGDDSIHTTFLLVESAHDDLQGVRIAALEGLGTRHYQTGLAILTLLQGLRADNPPERAAALTSLSKRWHRDAQSTYIGRLDSGKLGTLLDCAGISFDPSLYTRLETLDAASTINLTSPATLCSIGLGAQLLRLKHDVWKQYETVAQNALVDAHERVAAIAGLGDLAAGSADDRIKARGLAYELLPMSEDAEIKSALLNLVVTTINSDTDIAAIVELYPFLQAQLRQALAGDDPKAVGIALHPFVSLGLIRSPYADPESQKPLATGFLRDECIAVATVASAVRMGCFLAASGGFELAAEKAILPVVQESLAHGSFTERSVALDVLASGAFSYVDAEGAFVNCDLRQAVASKVVETTLEIIKSGLGAEAPLIGRYIALVKSLTVESPEIVDCPILSDSFDAFVTGLKRPRIRDWMEGLLAANLPILPMKSWYDEFHPPQSRRDVIEPIMISIPSQPDKRIYATRADLNKAMEDKLLQRSLEQLFVNDYAWQALQDLYGLANSERQSEGADAGRLIEKDPKEAFWGVFIKLEAN